MDLLGLRALNETEQKTYDEGMKLAAKLVASGKPENMAKGATLQAQLFGWRTGILGLKKGRYLPASEHPFPRNKQVRLEVLLILAKPLFEEKHATYGTWAAEYCVKKGRYNCSQPLGVASCCSDICKLLCTVPETLVDVAAGLVADDKGIQGCEEKCIDGVDEARERWRRIYEDEEEDEG
jgi:hypothetical protein